MKLPPAGGGTPILDMRTGLFLGAALLLAVPAPARLPGKSGPADEDLARARQCLTTAIAYEAGFEPDEGQQAVAEVILNRARHPSYPKTVCGVVFAGSNRRTGCQFSFTCDGSLARRLSESVIARSRRVAEAALTGLTPSRVAGATHYHADYVAPYWAPSLVQLAKIGAHIFYRLPVGADRSGLARPYVPHGEPSIGKLANIISRSAATKANAPSAPEPPREFAPWGLATPVSSSRPAL